jgi:hypothetical protein
MRGKLTFWVQLLGIEENSVSPLKIHFFGLLEHLHSQTHCTSEGDLVLNLPVVL